MSTIRATLRSVVLSPAPAGRTPVSHGRRLTPSATAARLARLTGPAIRRGATDSATRTDWYGEAR